MNLRLVVAAVVGAVVGLACGQLALDGPSSVALRRDPIAFDDCSMTGTISLGQTVTGTTAGALNDFNCNFSSQGPDVVYAFTPSSSGAVLATLNPVGTSDAGVFGMGLSLMQSACSTDGGVSCAGSTSTFSFPIELPFRATAGTTSYLVVDSYSSSVQGPFSLLVIPFNPPANDVCAGAITITTGTVVTADFTRSFDDYRTSFMLDGGVGCGSSSPDLTYRFTPPTTGRYAFSGSVSLSLSTGTCGTGCSGSNSNFNADLVGGTTYFLIAEGSGVATFRVDAVAVPSNDVCSMPATMTAGQTVSGTTVGASNDFNCGFSWPGPDVVYSFTPSASGAFVAQLGGAGGDGGFPFGLAPTIYQGVCDGGCLNGNFNFGFTAEATFRGTAGTPYFIVVDAISPSTQSPFSLTLQSFTPAANDTCSAPIAVTTGTPVSGNYQRAFDDYRSTFGFDGGTATCGSGVNDLVYTFVPPTTGRYAFSGGVSTWLSTGTCGQSCTIGGASAYNADLVGGVTYFILAEGSATASFRIDPVIVPPNDTCSMPTPISVGQTLTGTLVGANDNVSCNFQFNGPDVLYSFTPASSGAYLVTIGGVGDGGDGGAFGLGAGLFSASCDAGCLTGTSPFSFQTELNFRGTAATPYLIAVDSPSSASPGPFTISLSSFVPPANDLCAGALPINVGTTYFQTFTRAFDDYRQLFGFDGGTGCGTTNADLTYTFVPPASGRYTFSGSASLWISAGACNAASCTFGGTFFNVDLVGGTTYFIIAEGSGSTSFQVNAVGDGGTLPTDGGSPVDGGFGGGSAGPDGGFGGGSAGGGSAGGGSAGTDGGFGGGSTGGGSAAGGSAAGGSTAGGSTAGGSTAGGSTAGGSTAGGAAGGGSTAGGAAGGSTAGGSTAGGSTAGGSTAGGSTAGGSTAGGSTAGGSTAGGSAGGGGTMTPGGCGCTSTSFSSLWLGALGLLFVRRRRSA